jgi:ketol-acid reductoisomerase
MHRETADQLVDCADCGAKVNVGLQRGYTVGENAALCWSCAIERGARFDEDEDRWSEAPDVTGLIPDEEHKYR